MLFGGYMDINKNFLMPPTSLEFEESINRIKNCGFDMPVFSSELKNASGLKISNSYIEADVRRSDLTDCEFIDSDFSRAVLADSRCFNTKFRNVILHHSNVEYCHFYSCDFIDESQSQPYIGTNFSFSDFINCSFKGVEIKNSTLDSVSFDNSEFENTAISMSTIENSKFKNCLLRNVNLCDLNLCFSDFENVKMEQVALPFYQLPYVFNGVDYFLHTNDNVYIGPDASAGSILRPEEYRRLLPDVITYFKKYNEYFPVANIYIACDKKQYAFETIVLGIEMASHKKDFRMLKFLCKLAADSNMFTYLQLQSLYDKIYDVSAFGYMTDYEKKSYFIHLGSIRRTLLFNDSQKNTLEFRMLTNIDNSESERLGILIVQIEKIFSIFQEHNTLEDNSSNITYNIEMKHQCPWEIIYIIIGSMPYIQCILQSLSALMTPTNNVLALINNCINLTKHLFTKPESTSQENGLDAEIKQQQLILLKQDETLKQQQIYMNSLNISLLEKQLLESRQLLANQNIFVQTSYHIK